MEENNNKLEPLIRTSKSKIIESKWEIKSRDEKIYESCTKKEKSCKKPWKLIFIAILSLTIFYTMWFTDGYNTLMLQTVILRNNSLMLSWWLRPPVDPIVKVHIFNYTNIESFLNGTDEKIKVKEIGPYAFRDDVEKVNLEFHDDSISFYENRTHVFDPALSGENLNVNDVLNVPNLGFISAIVNVKQMGFFAEIGLKTAISAIKPQEFQNLTVKEFLFGHENELVTLISKIRWDIDPKDVSMLGYRDGLMKRKFTVERGRNDIGGLGQFSAIEGKTKETMWTSERCNEIHGSDLALYNTTALRKKDILYLFPPEIHRALPIQYIEKRLIYGLPSFYYQAKLDIFDYNNTFYCEPKSLKTPHVKGTIELSDTINGNPPLIGSYAHFMNADPKLLEPFEGLKPNLTKHTPYAYIQPRIGMIIKGSLIWQLNFKVTALKNHYKKFDGLTLPLAWIEFTVDEVPLRFKMMLFMISPICDIFEVFLKYGSIITFLYSIFKFIKVFKKNNQK